MLRRLSSTCSGEPRSRVGKFDERSTDVFNDGIVGVEVNDWFCDGREEVDMLLSLPMV